MSEIDGRNGLEARVVLPGELETVAVDHLTRDVDADHPAGLRDVAIDRNKHTIKRRPEWHSTIPLPAGASSAA